MFYPLAVFWVRKDQKYLAEPTASIVDVRDNVVGRTFINGELIGGRVGLGIFFGALNGTEYVTFREVEVHPAAMH